MIAVGAEPGSEGLAEHGLLAYALDDYIKATGYWTDRNTKSGTAGAEAPITSYGDTNAAEATTRKRGVP